MTETVDYMYEQVNLNFGDSADIDAISVFEKVYDLGILVSLIVEQSELYIKQKGIPFQTNSGLSQPEPFAIRLIFTHVWEQ